MPEKRTPWGKIVVCVLAGGGALLLLGNQFLTTGTASIPDILLALIGMFVAFIWLEV